MTRTDYDLLGRPVAIFVTDSKGSTAAGIFAGRGSFQAAVTTVAYRGLSVTTTNDKNQVRIEEKNAEGQVVRVTNHLGAQIAYQHDAFGNLVQTKDALQNLTKIYYDIRGRKKKLIDPDSGTSEYDYNALGEMIWQRTANQALAQKATEMAYDLLGRMTQRIEPEDYTSYWYYDKNADGSACGKSIGKLCETKTTNGIGKRYVYDALGRAVNTRTTVINGPSFASAIAYDSSSGRPSRQTWPTGLAVDYNYTSNGFLNTVTLATSATLTPFPASASAPAPEPVSSWTECANEGGTCTVSGTREVRYGAGTSFVTKMVTGSIACTNAVFGDPTPGVVKSCSFANTAPVSWTECASEGATCTVSGTREVRYGAGTSFVTKMVTGSIACTNAVFGDPAPNVVKSCSFASTTSGGGTPGASVSLPAGTVLWQAKTYTAWGKAEEFSYGNNVVSKMSFDAQTGRALSATAGAGTSTAVMNYSYAWDSLNHLTGRTDANGDGTTGAVTDSFEYDDIGRLESYSVNAPAIPNLARTVRMQYNALGMILSKSDVGVYTYKPQGSGVDQPHALQSVAGAFAATYEYDYNGNLKTASAGGYRSINYTSFNLPSSLEGPPGGSKYTWLYDENHQRIKEVRETANGIRITWQVHPDSAGGLAFESEQNGSATYNRHYITAGGQVIGVLISNGALPTLTSTQTSPPTITDLSLTKLEYWHKDHLGSLASTTDHAGAVTARYSYDPFGKRRHTNGNYDANGNLVVDWTTNTNNGTDRGWTGHEHLDDVGVVHMNGRTFDPRLGLFMQADPFVQDPMNLQNFNRYSYCYNNPMTCTDPTGQFFSFTYFAYALIAIWTAEKLDIIDVKTARMLSSIAFAAFVAPTGIFESAATGFASGAIATGNVKGALQGAFTAGLFNGAGTLITDAGLSRVAEVALHGVVGCVTSVSGGGKCGPGALSASFSKALAPTVSAFSGENVFAGALISAVAGGTGSVLGGGKFANGAMTGAFGYLFNCAAHECWKQGGAWCSKSYRRGTDGCEWRNYLHYHRDRLFLRCTNGCCRSE